MHARSSAMHVRYSAMLPCAGVLGVFVLWHRVLGVCVRACVCVCLRTNDLTGIKGFVKCAVNNGMEI